MVTEGGRGFLVGLGVCHLLSNCVLDVLSSLLRSTSGRLKNNRHVPPVPAQAELPKLLSEEAHDHAWEFDTERISGILSATGKSLSDILVNSAHKALRGKGSLD